MKHAILPDLPARWFRHLFDAKAARDGGVVRRKVRDMELMVGRDLFERELRRRGFSAVENAGQVIIFCNAEPVRMTVRGAKSSLRICDQSFEETLVPK